MTKRKHSSKTINDEDDEIDEEEDDDVREEMEAEAKEERIYSRGIKVIRAICLERCVPTKEMNSVVIFADRSDQSYWQTVCQAIQTRRGTMFTGNRVDSNCEVLIYDYTENCQLIVAPMDISEGVKEDYVQAVCHHVRNSPRLKIWSSSSLTLRHDEPEIRDITIQQLPLNHIRASIFYHLASGNAY